MRGDTMLHLRLLRQPQGVVGVVATVAGASALAASYLPWYQVAATVQMLGTEQSRPVATLPGWQAHPWGWVVPALAVIAMVNGAMVALDRPPPWTAGVATSTGLGLTVTVVAGLIWFPPVTHFDVAGSRLRALADLAGRLPKDVDLSFHVRPAAGLWLTLAAAALLLATAATSRARR